jgi:hypothetical protein
MITVDVDLRETINLTVPRAIERQRFADLLCSAVEGGSGYWAAFRNSERTADLDYISIDVQEHEASTADGSEPSWKRITHDDLARGCVLLAARPFPAALQHLCNFLDENDDAETADVILQMAVFGNVIYG